MSWRTGGVLVLSGLLMFAAACSSADRGGDETPSASSPQSERSTQKPATPSTSGQKSAKAKPQVDPAKASPDGLNVRYLENGKINRVDVPDFDH